MTCSLPHDFRLPIHCAACGFPPSHLTPERLADQLWLLPKWIVIYLGSADTHLPVVSFTREAIQLEGAARDKARRKLELPEHTLLTPAGCSRCRTT